MIFEGTWIFSILLLLYLSTSFLVLKEPRTMKPHTMSNHEFVDEDILPKPFEDSLRSLCNSTIWRPGLYLNCTNKIRNPSRFEDHGDNWGTFNTRSALSSCVSWAIDGGMGLIMPLMAIRSEYDLEYFPQWTNISFLFDLENFRKTLHEQCPQLIVRNTFSEISTQIKAPMPKSFIYYTHGMYRKRSNQLLRMYNITPSVTNPVVIWENKPLFGWGFSNNRLSIHKALLGAFAFRVDVMVVSKVLSDKMTEPFVGFHLRAESDEPWYTYGELRDWCLYYMLNNYTKIKNVYVSSGDVEILDMFIKDLAAVNLTVISKWTLTNDDVELKSQLLAMEFDQVAIIDYEILKKSTVFLGVGQSSYSYAVAFERGKGYLENCGCHIRGQFGFAFRCCY